MTYRLGYLPDPPDARDHTHERMGLSSARLPESASLRPFVVEVMDQRATSACVAFSTAQALRVCLSAQGVAAPPLPSRLAIYWAARAVSGLTDRDDGCYIRSAFAQLGSLGWATESDWPFSEERVFARPPWYVWRDGYDAKLTGYYRIAVTGQARIEAVKAAIAARHPVVAGFRVDAAFMNLAPAEIWPGPSSDEGGHAICLTGYDADAVEFVNSWGYGYGDNGFGRIAWDAVADPLVCSDVWVPTVAVAPKEAA